MSFFGRTLKASEIHDLLKELDRWMDAFIENEDNIEDLVFFDSLFTEMTRIYRELLGNANPFDQAQIGEVLERCMSPCRRFKEHKNKQTFLQEITEARMGLDRIRSHYKALANQ